jgi:3-methyl-2-oxobutanoate hydroxymethyltransferase
MTTSESDVPVTVATLRAMKKRGEPIACLTAYDASFASVLDRAGVDVVLVGDSLGMVIKGERTTLPVTVDDMVHHARAVASGLKRALLMVDMPFMSYATPERALDSASRLLKEGGAHMLKLEGGADQAGTVRGLSALGIPICAHLGLQPQSVHKLGGYRVQGREAQAAQLMLEDARLLEAAGADALVLECIPRDLAKRISSELSIPVIGIGAGPDCDGQVLVLYDMLGITPGKLPRFVRQFTPSEGGIPQAVADYVRAVRSREFPAPEHCFE